MAKLDARQFQAQLEQAEGQLMRDKALLEQAEIDLKRYKTLFAQDSIAKQQLDLQNSLVKQYKGAVRNDQGLVDAAKTQVDYTKITSPVNGRVGLRQVDVGNIVHSSDANGIVIVTEVQPITAIFTIPEDNIPAVMQHIGAQEKLVVEAWDRDNKNQLETGSLSAVDNQVDQTTGTVKFRAQFANKENKLFPNQFINIKLRLETKTGATLIPAAGVLHGTQGTFVYLVKDQTVAVQLVTVGTVEGGMAAIEKGLQVGDVIVVDGSDNLRDGAKVQVTTIDNNKVGADAANDKADANHSSDHKHKKHSKD